MPGFPLDGHIYRLLEDVSIVCICVRPCRLLEVLQSESRALDNLVRLGIHSEWHVPLLGLSVHGSESKNVVVDVRSKEVIVSIYVCACVGMYVCTVYSILSVLGAIVLIMSVCWDVYTYLSVFCLPFLPF